MIKVDTIDLIIEKLLDRVNNNKERDKESSVQLELPLEVLEYYYPEIPTEEEQPKEVRIDITSDSDLYKKENNEDIIIQM